MGNTASAADTNVTPQSGSNVAFRAIGDNHESLPQVQDALRKAGLESSQLILAIDYTKSNEWTGARSNHGRSLHAINNEVLNPYEQVISIVARTLSAFDDDNLIPCYGFGDATTGDKRVFSFKDNDEPCNGLEEVQAMYRALTPHVKLSGPTSFAPAIHQAIRLVAASGGQYHILLLVADGQVTRSSDMRPGELSEQEQATVNAIVEASKWPLSIVMVGVGDGPWDTVKEFDDALPARAFDNFQFCCATDIFKDYASDPSRMEACFALNALMEVPDQFRAIQRMGLLGRAPARPYHIPDPAPCPRPRLPPPAPYTYTYAPHQHQPAPAAAFPPAAPPPHQPYPLQSTSFNGYGGAQYAVGVPVAQQAQHDRPSAPPWPAGAAAVPHGASFSSRTSFDRHSAASAGAVSASTANALFVCPITQEVMADPVIAGDGYSYERTAIEQWLRSSDASPMSNAPLPHKLLIPNHQLRSSIQEWRQQTGGAGV